MVQMDTMSAPHSADTAVISNLSSVLRAAPTVTRRRLNHRSRAIRPETVPMPVNPEIHSCCFRTRRMSMIRAGSRRRTYRVFGGCFRGMARDLRFSVYLGTAQGRLRLVCPDIAQDPRRLGPVRRVGRPGTPPPVTIRTSSYISPCRVVLRDSGDSSVARATELRILRVTMRRTDYPIQPSSTAKLVSISSWGPPLARSYSTRCSEGGWS